MAKHLKLIMNRTYNMNARGGGSIKKVKLFKSQLYQKKICSQSTMYMPKSIVI